MADGLTSRDAMEAAAAYHVRAEESPWSMKVLMHWLEQTLEH